MEQNEREMLEKKIKKLKSDSLFLKIYLILSLIVLLIHLLFN
jgi:hypothetical protein